jgi:O-antigen/teichoic acid export membrane protein
MNSLGLKDSLTRELPIALGKGDRRECDDIKDAVFTGNAIVTFLTIIILWGLFLDGGTLKGSLNLTIVILLTVVLITRRTATLINSYVRAIGNFRLIGRKDLILNITMPLILVPLVILFKVEGVLVSTIIGNLVTILYLSRYGERVKLRLFLPVKKTIHLIKIGFVVYMTSTAGVIFWTIDLTLIAFLLPVREAGIFGFALGGFAFAEAIPNSFNPMIYQHMLVKKGEHGLEKGSSYFQKYMKNPITGYLMLCAIVAGCSLFFYVFVVNVFLTRYYESIPVVKILAFGFMIYKSRVFANFYLNVTDQLGKLLLIQCIGVALNIALDYILISKGYGIVGAAWGSTISFFVFSFFVIIFSMKQIYGSHRASLAFFGKLVTVSCLLMGVLLSLDAFKILPYLSAETIYWKIILGIGDVFVKVVIYSVMCILVYSLVYREHNLFQDVQTATRYIIDLIRQKVLNMTAGSNVS